MLRVEIKRPRLSPMAGIGGLPASAHVIVHSCRCGKPSNPDPGKVRSLRNWIIFASAFVASPPSTRPSDPISQPQLTNPSRFCSVSSGTCRNPAQPPSSVEGSLKANSYISIYKASAALSRRLLQMLLHDEARINRSTLVQEIDELLAAKTLPSYLASDVDAIRNIGNFAAHPTKDTNSGEIVPVEPGEAEWLLDVLEGLFDFYFVQPVIATKRKADLNKKLAEAGKPPIK